MEGDRSWGVPLEDNYGAVQVDSCEVEEWGRRPLYLSRQVRARGPMRAPASDTERAPRQERGVCVCPYRGSSLEDRLLRGVVRLSLAPRPLYIGSGRAFRVGGVGGTPSHRLRCFCPFGISTCSAFRICQNV